MSTIKFNEIFLIRYIFLIKFNWSIIHFCNRFNRFHCLIHFVLSARNKFVNLIKKRERYFCKLYENCVDILSCIKYRAVWQLHRMLLNSTVLRLRCSFMQQSNFWMRSWTSPSGMRRCSARENPIVRCWFLCNRLSTGICRRRRAGNVLKRKISF